ncbi:MAG: tRNA (adenosine(37)-N6)-dimethylallyltransferase MiaA [Candidatus Aerophobetes bacterium]|nr:tRNA (adenosine(37)-N6)-dimethylallyltransferase MiaA [Candidatus Aerophobetes bacterium]
MLKALLIILGPTGVGKTEVALSLLKKIKGEIISADSRQIYKDMDIGTAKTSRKIREEFPHHLVDIVFPGQVFSAAEFKKRAEVIIKSLQDEDKLPVVVGGSGLYIKAVVDGLFAGPGADWKLREELKERVKRESEESLYQELKKIDPHSASRIHPHDEVRIIRALEVYYLTKKPISSYQKQSFSSLSNTVMIGLRRKRAILYELINQRVDKMIQEGLISEAESLLSKGYSEDLFSLQGLGYKHIIKYLKGDYSKEEAIRLMKRDTRRFAKRQLNYFKQDRRIIWLDMGEYSSSEDVSNEIIKIISQKLPQNVVQSLMLSS